MKFLIVLMGFAVMVLMIKYRYPIRNFTGEFSVAEKYLGSGGTVNLIVLIALFTFIGSLMYGLGTLQGLINATFGKFF